MGRCICTALRAGALSTGRAAATGAGILYVHYSINRFFQQALHPSVQVLGWIFLFPLLLVFPAFWHPGPKLGTRLCRQTSAAGPAGAATSDRYGIATRFD